MTSFRLKVPLIISLACTFLILGGCGSPDDSELHAYIKEILARPGGRIEALPEIEPYEAYAYQSASQGARDPFRPFYKADEETLAQEEENAGLTKEMEDEIKHRNKEDLEQYELDSLRMVGTMDNGDTNWGIIQDPSGAVHRVRVGNYMGRNIGKVLNIFEDRIEVREIVKNSQGRWEERQAAIALAEVE